MSSKNPLVATTGKKLKEGINDMEKNPYVVKEAITPPIEKIILTQSKKQINHKYLKEKKLNPSEINQTKVNHLINQGLIKELKQKIK